MGAAGVYERYHELQRYVGWTADDADRLRAVRPLVEPAFGQIVDDFYEQIDRNDATRAIIRGGQEQIVRLKVTLRGWLEQLFSGTYDADFVESRYRVGRRHVEIGLEQIYAGAALARIRSQLHGWLAGCWPGDRESLCATLQSLDKLLDLDLAIIEYAYHAEFCARQQRMERLAALGQVAGGIAHELRNPLNAVRMSVYYLLNAPDPTPQKAAEHLARIDRQIDLASSVVTALTEFSQLPLPKLRSVDVARCVRSVLETTPLPASIEVVLDGLDAVPCALGDEKQLQIVLGNLIRNARDAMPDGGCVQITARETEAGLELAVIDTGIGIPPGDLHRVMEPLYSTKAYGIGLGLAISRSILERHGGSLSVQSRQGQGTRFTLRLSKAPQERRRHS